MTTIDMTPATAALYARAFMLDSRDADFIDSLRATTHDDDDAPLTDDDADSFADACIDEMHDDLDSITAYFAFDDATDAEIEQLHDAFLALLRSNIDSIYAAACDASRARLARILDNPR